MGCIFSKDEDYLELSEELFPPRSIYTPPEVSYKFNWPSFCKSKNDDDLIEQEFNSTFRQDVTAYVEMTDSAVFYTPPQIPSPK